MTVHVILRFFFLPVNLSVNVSVAEVASERQACLVAMATKKVITVPSLKKRSDVKALFLMFEVGWRSKKKKKKKEIMIFREISWTVLAFTFFFPYDFF